MRPPERAHLSLGTAFRSGAAARCARVADNGRPSDGGPVVTAPAHEVVESISGVDSLAAHLLDESRSRPVCVVTTAWAADTPTVDPAELQEAVGDICDVVLIATGELTFRLTDLLPPRSGVWDGAARVYGTDDGWQRDPFSAPLRMPRRGTTPERMRRELESDALLAARAGGAFERATESSMRAEGTVRGFAHADRALVQLDTGRLATVPHELVAPDLPFDWVLRTGDRLRGSFDPATGRFLPDHAQFDAAASYPDRAVVPALVSEVDPSRALLLLHPRTAVPIGRAAVSTNPLDTLDLLLTAGDVVAVRVLHRPDAVAELSLLDVDDDETVLDAPPIVIGGPPWLVVGRDLRTEPEAPPLLPVEETDPRAAAPPPPPPTVEPEQPQGRPQPPEPPRPSAAPRHGPHLVAASRQRTTSPASAPLPMAAQAPSGKALQATQLQLAQLKAEMQRLGRDLAYERAAGAAAAVAARNAEHAALDAERSRAAAHAELAKAKRTSSKQAGALRDDRRSMTPRARRDWFVEADEWVRLEILLAWAERVSATEKAFLPLPEYDLDPRFAASIGGLEDAGFRKAMRASIDVLVGRVGDVPAREAHPLRSGRGGDDPDVVRPGDRARCWRAYIENVAAQAKRLHWWAIPGGRIELIRVVSHDDVEP